MGVLLLLLHIDYFSLLKIPIVIPPCSLLVRNIFFLRTIIELYAPLNIYSTTFLHTLRSQTQNMLSFFEKEVFLSIYNMYIKNYINNFRVFDNGI
jgi:hypothetical protein